jgi:hypothetical protein
MKSLTKIVIALGMLTQAIAAPVTVYMCREKVSENHYVLPIADQQAIAEWVKLNPGQPLPQTAGYSFNRSIIQSLVVRDSQYGVEVRIPLTLEDGEKYFAVPFSSKYPGDYTKLNASAYGWRSRIYPVGPRRILEVELHGGCEFESKTSAGWHASQLTGYQRLMTFGNGHQYYIAPRLSGTTLSSYFTNEEDHECSSYGSSTTTMTLLRNLTNELGEATEDAVDEATGLTYTAGNIAYGTLHAVYWLQDNGYLPISKRKPAQSEE